MKLFKANHYFTSQHGLDIADESGEIVINVKAHSSKQVETIARKLLSELNRDYYTKKALIEDNDQNFDWGLITNDERLQKEKDILAQTF